LFSLAARAQSATLIAGKRLAVNAVNRSCEQFLIVEDDALVSRALVRNLGGAERVAAVAASVKEATKLAAALAEVTGAIVDINLPDGNGFEVVSLLRSSRPGLPILVMTGNFDPELANRCQALGVEFAYKPASTENLLAFVKRASLLRRMSHGALAACVDGFAQRHRLSRRERELMVLALEGVRRGEAARQLGVTESTVKMQIRSLLRKTGHENLSSLVQLLLREAFLATVPQYP
jgi:DNA-binding NarL/FixJ family response regulator